MLKVYVSLVLMILSNILHSQDVIMISEYSSENPELSDLLAFEKIDFYKVKFIGKDIGKKDYSLVCKEIWNGDIKRIDTLINTTKYTNMPKSISDTLALKVYAKRTEESKLNLWFRFPKIGIERKFEATSSYDYSLRDVGLSETIQYGKQFYAFAYILPYEKDGMKFWCAVDSSGKNIENWGKDFGLEHYLIFEMEFK
jgi:Fe-S cluster biosynthesis and repair protein YggX